MDRHITFQVVLGSGVLQDNVYEATTVFHRLANDLRTTEFIGQKPRRVGVGGSAHDPTLYVTFPEHVIETKSDLQMKRALIDHLQTCRIDNHIIVKRPTDERLELSLDPKR